MNLSKDVVAVSQEGQTPMARETKVGLLAGLAFIICFAIILTNRGRDSTVAPPRPVMSDSGGGVPANLQQTASRTSHRPTPTAPTSGAELALADRSAQNPVQGNPIPSPALPMTLPGGLTERDLTSRTADPAPIATLPQTTLVPGQTANPLADPTPARTTHTVAPGETLSKIALAYYGSKSKSFIDSIYAANKAAMPSPDSLKPGMVLTLPNTPSPTRGDATASSSPTRGDATPSPSPTRGDATASQNPPANPVVKPAEEPKVARSKPPTDSGNAARFYQIKKNDRWVSIARDQLGDAGRWKELHELNKDKFPDPQKIREGVRVKLPAGKSVASAEGRR